MADTRSSVTVRTEWDDIGLRRSIPRSNGPCSQFNYSIFEHRQYIKVSQLYTYFLQRTGWDKHGGFALIHWLDRNQNSMRWSSSFWTYLITFRTTRTYKLSESTCSGLSWPRSRCRLSHLEAMLVRLPSMSATGILEIDDGHRDGICPTSAVQKWFGDLDGVAMRTTIRWENCSYRAVRSISCWTITLVAQRKEIKLHGYWTAANDDYSDSSRMVHTLLDGCGLSFHVKERDGCIVALMVGMTASTLYKEDSKISFVPNCSAKLKPWPSEEFSIPLVKNRGYCFSADGLPFYWHSGAVTEHFSGKSILY